MSDLLFLLPGLYVLLQTAQLVVLWSYRDQKESEPAEWPEISILVAARNEEENILLCLEAINRLDYPREKLHILIGNDQSTDRTAAITTAFIADKPWFSLIEIEDTELPLKAKARVMEQLDRHARGSFYLITDADVQVPPSWAKEMLLRFKPETGVVSGTTMVKSPTGGDRNQEIDWTYFMGLLNIISYAGVPATAVGNNMAVRSEAYRETGGYAAIRFSITEDYKLYQQICAAGWKWNNIIAPGVLAFSAPVYGWETLLHQRKRWLTGGRELPWYWWLLFGIFGLFYFALPVALFVSLFKALVIWLIKWLLQSAQIRHIYGLLGEEKPDWAVLLRYEIYLLVLTPATAIFTLLPVATNWKDRFYKGKDL